MPIYVYECPEKHVTERIKSIKTPIVDLDTDICATCNQVANLIPVRVGRPILVGEGFHQNDYRHGRLGS